jgi:DNA polymerase sigma
VDQADVEIIKLTFMGMSIDISIGQHGGLCTLDFMNHFDRHVVGQDHLLKRSIMLLKAWMTYESSLLGSQLACMATYALYTLVIYIFNNYSEGIKSEMQFFRKFFEILGDFDWDKHLITIYGPIRIQNLYDKLRDECNFDLN